MNISIGIIGSKNSGKSTYIQRLVNGNFVAEYHPTLDIATSNLTWNTNLGPVKIELVEYPENQQHGSHDSIISMSLLSEYPTIYGVADIHLFTKFDTLAEDTNTTKINSFSKRYLQGRSTLCWQLSSKSNFNLEKPLLAALRKKFGNHLYFKEW